MDRAEVNGIVKGFLFSGMPIMKADEDGAALAPVVDAIKGIFDVHMPEIKSAAEEYAVTEDLDALILSLLPFHNLIWYEAYAPYWLSHCQPVSDDPDYTYFNDLIGMHWHWKHQVWKKKGEDGCTIMLPPTRGLMTLDYAEAVESLNNYYRTHRRDGHISPHAMNKKGTIDGE